MIACPHCPREIVPALFAAHLRRHNQTDWFSERRPVVTPRPGMGSRSRRDRTPDGGEGRPQTRYRRPRPGASHIIPGRGRP